MFRSTVGIVVALWSDDRSNLPLQSRPVAAWFYLARGGIGYLLGRGGRHRFRRRCNSPERRPIDDGLVVRNIWLLRLRALLAPAHAT